MKELWEELVLELLRQISSNWQERWDKILRLVTALVFQTSLCQSSCKSGISTYLVPALPPIFVHLRRRKLQQIGLPGAFNGRELCHAVGFAPFVLKQKKLLQGLSNCRVRASNTITLLKCCGRRKESGTGKAK